MAIHSLLIYHTDLPLSVSTSFFEHGPARRHMDSKLACRGIWFLLESNPGSQQGPSTHPHLRVENAKISSPGDNIFFKSLNLEISLKNLNDYLPKSFCVAPVRPCFGILHKWENDNDRLGTFPIQPISVESLNSFTRNFEERDRRKVCYGAYRSRWTIGFVRCWLKKNIPQKGRKGSHAPQNSLYLYPWYGSGGLLAKEEMALSTTLSERLEMQTIIQKLGLSACRVIQKSSCVLSLTTSTSPFYSFALPCKITREKWLLRLRWKMKLEYSRRPFPR